MHHLNSAIWAQSNSLDDKLNYIKTLIDFRQKELDNFKKFLKKMELISAFLTHIEAANFGN